MTNETMSEKALERSSFQRRVRPKPAAELAAYVALAKTGSGEARSNAIDELCASLAWVAFACPAATASVYGPISSAWLGQEPDSLATDKVLDTEKCHIPTKFWEAFWAMVNDADSFDAISITLRSSALGQYVDSNFVGIAERAASLHPGADSPCDKQVPARIDPEKLAKNPPGSLADELHRMWCDNNFDPEVLDRDAIGLTKLPPALQYLNTRILQMHDVWHLVAGYETSALHEIAISGFQLAQFGHNYSSMFLAGIAKISAEKSPDGFGLLMHVVSEAWQHGRSTPAFMAIEWEEHWHKSVAELREIFGISPFESVFPADTLEQI